jgi:ABC-type amino acid transport system permease subunit
MNSTDITIYMFLLPTTTSGTRILNLQLRFYVKFVRDISQINISITWTESEPLPSLNNQYLACDQAFLFRLATLYICYPLALARQARSLISHFFQFTLYSGRSK